MAKKQRHTPEQVIGKLREAEVKLAKGTAIAQVCKDLAVTEETPSDCTPGRSSATRVYRPFPTTTALMCCRIEPGSGRSPSPVITSLPCPPSPIRREPTTPRRAQL
jgi:hypothetical protein